MILSLFILLLCGAEWSLVWSKSVSPEQWLGSPVQPPQLVMSVVLFRHGSRAPDLLYPTCKNTYWERGLGRLTRAGLEQEYNLGSLLKSLYIDNGFITSESQIKLHSTNYDRTITSARCVMAGMFPNEVPTQGFNEAFVQAIEKRWNPIITSETLVPSSPGYKPYCPAYLYIFASQIEKNIYELYDKYKTEIDQAVKGSGIHIPKHPDGSIDKIKLLERVVQFADTLFIEKYNGRPMPSWFNENLLYRLINHTDTLFHMVMEGDKARRLTGGVWADTILKLFEDRTNGIQSNQKKLYLFSAHDLTIIPMLNVFGLFTKSIKRPKYSTAFIIELFTQFSWYSGQEFLVKIRYRPNTDDNQLLDLVMPFCNSKLCYIYYVANNMEKYRLTASQFQNECQV